MVGFDPLGQAVERQRGTKPNRRVARREMQAEIFDIHECQYGLTLIICQPKLTQQTGWGKGLSGPPKAYVEAALAGLNRLLR